MWPWLWHNFTFFLFSLILLPTTYLLLDNISAIGLNFWTFEYLLYLRINIFPSNFFCKIEACQSYLHFSLQLKFCRSVSLVFKLLFHTVHHFSVDINYTFLIITQNKRSFKAKELLYHWFINRITEEIAVIRVTQNHSFMHILKIQRAMFSVFSFSRLRKFFMRVKIGKSKFE